MLQERETFDVLWTNLDFMIPKERQTLSKEHYTFVPVWTDSRSLVDPSSSQQISGKSVELYPPLTAAPSADFTFANIQGRAETDHDDNRLSGPRYGCDDFKYATRDNFSPIDLSWTPYGDQATTQNPEDNQQPSNPGLSQIGQTQTILSYPNVTQELAAAKADEAKWQEVLFTK